MSQGCETTCLPAYHSHSKPEMITIARNDDPNPVNLYKLILRLTPGEAGKGDNCSSDTSRTLFPLPVEHNFPDTARFTLGRPTFALSPFNGAAFTSFLSSDELGAQSIASDPGRGKGEPGGVNDTTSSLGLDGWRL